MKQLDFQTCKTITKFIDKCCQISILTKREILHSQRFYNTFTTNLMQVVIISSNLNSQLKFLFYLLIMTNNKILIRIYT